jgi:branched-chain amino acid transport system permease protein
MGGTRVHPASLTLLLAVALAAAAALLPSFRLFLVGQLSVIIMVTAAMTLLMGAAGLLSLASAATMATGAYGTLILALTFHVPFPLAAIFAVAAGALTGLGLGLVALRLSGFHLAIITLGFLQLVLVLLKRGGALTGGGYGLVVPPLDLPGLGKLSTGHFAVASIVCAVLTVAACTSLVHSRVGRAWLALRDNEAAAMMQGIDIRSLKVLAFVFTSVVISIAGILHILLLGVANPNSYVVDTSIFHITLVVVGGTTGSMSGAVAAPVILYLLPEMFGFLGEWRDFFYACTLLLTLLFMPRGMGPTLGDAAERWRARQGRSSRRTMLT